ncbi:MAG: Holliday junction resolvase RuvX [Clostridia bacterium]|nr:Holliday junction resolvase RuvX [Clostridia bacterium]
MRVLGIDFGEARMGIAVSDPTGFLASGIGTVKVTGFRSAVEAAVKAAKDNNAELIVVGLPVNMDGSCGERAEKCRSFAKEVAEKSGIKTEMYDERRTTILAAGFMNETGTYGKKRKDAIDTLSAQIILQSYLDRNKAF